MTPGNKTDLANGDEFRGWLYDKMLEWERERGEQTSLLKTVVRQNAEQYERLHKLDTTGCAVGDAHRVTLDKHEDYIKKLARGLVIAFIILAGIVGADKVIGFLM